MKEGLDWFPLYTHKFWNGVEGMGPDISVYILLLVRIYDLGGEIPRNDKLIAGHGGLSLAFVRNATDRLIDSGRIEVLTDGKLTNPLAQRVARKKDAMSLVRAEAGAKGGKANAAKRRQMDQSVKDKFKKGSQT